MKPESSGYNVRASCPDCKGAVTSFEYQYCGKELGVVVQETSHRYPEPNGPILRYVHFRLLRCASCGRGGFAKLHDNGNLVSAILEDFYPAVTEFAQVPSAVPTEIVAELREAERCAATKAWRAASAMIRSVLEKTLKSNGYTKGNLESKIDLAATDGVITAPRKERAHRNIRDLGNDVLHDEWREVTSTEYESSHLYAQRILEDFYDDRPTVDAMLKEKGRLPLKSES
jgi:hypothetical protein